MNASSHLLDRATPYLRRPEGLSDTLRIDDGILDLLGEGPVRRGAQLSLDRPIAAWVYAELRQGVVPTLLGLPPFEAECERLRSELALEPGDVVLDLACGHGNFSVAIAEAVGPEGIVIAIDISRAMLGRAVKRVERAGLENVLLIWGDAHVLPIADDSLTKLNCSGGFHAMPDLPRAVSELARVSMPGARLTASSFAASESDPRDRLKAWLDRRFGVNFVSLPMLGHTLASVGFGSYDSSMAGAWLGYASARREAAS